MCGWGNTRGSGGLKFSRSARRELESYHPDGAFLFFIFAICGSVLDIYVQARDI